MQLLIVGLIIANDVMDSSETLNIQTKLHLLAGLTKCSRCWLTSAKHEHTQRRHCNQHELN